MSFSNNRFGRRTGRQNDDPRFEPVLSFNPKRPGARPAQNGPAPTGPAPSDNRKPQAGLRVDREDAREFRMPFDDDVMRDDDFDPRTRREKAFEPRDTDSEQMLYRHLFDERETRRRGFGWLAALGSVAIVAIGAGYAWHNFMDRPAPGNLFEPPGFAARGHNTGYVTPPQPATTDATAGADAGSSAAPLAATTPPPPATPSTTAQKTDLQPAKDIAAAPEPKSVPSEPPPAPKKTISEAAANPGSLGPAASPAPPPAPATAKEPAPAAPAAPMAKDQPAATPAPAIAPPPKRETVKTDTPKREAPRKEASIAPPRRATAPLPQNPAPEELAPPAVSEPAAAPAVASPPPRRSRAQATGQPQALTREPPATAYAAPPQAERQPLPPDNLGPPPAAPDTVTVDGLTYVNGQEPRTLGTLGGPPQAASNTFVPPDLPAVAPPPPRPAYTARPYTPTDHEGGAPLPNDVIILPSGQMAVPDGAR